MSNQESKAPGKSLAKAAKSSTKSGQKITRATTANRTEVRQQKVNIQGHGK